MRFVVVVVVVVVVRSIKGCATTFAKIVTPSGGKKITPSGGEKNPFILGVWADNYTCCGFFRYFSFIRTFFSDYCQIF